MGVKEGIAQANHGKVTPLRRMKKDDIIIYYSTFSPFRRRVEYYHECKEIPIEDLIPALSFIKNKKSWGYIFRFGLIQIPYNDFLTISDEMCPDKVHMFVM